MSPGPLTPFLSTLRAMNRTLNTLAMTTACLAWTSLATTARAAEDQDDKRPNIIVILADDFGWGDTQRQHAGFAGANPRH